MAGVDTDPDQTFEIVERDAVPAPAPQPNDSHEQRIRSLEKWLQPTDFLSPGSEFMKHLHSYVPGTGGWIHKSPVFRTWTNVDASSDQDHVGGSCLHVRGVAGSGKSVFAASTVRQLQESGNIVLFFFFRQIVDKNHSANYLVRDFTAQLLPHCPALVTTLTAISQDHAISRNENSLVWPALVEALTKSISKNVYCVVDALDEMDDGDFEGMTSRLIELGAVVPEKVKVMMTSRPLPKIEQAFNNRGIVRLKLDPALLFPDVARYVDARMAKLEPPLSDDKNELIKQTICERANGLFLHARLIADNLAEGLRDGHITEETLPGSLDRLPRTLQEVYENMLKEHAYRSGVTAEQQAKVLTCVTHASRPLRLIELGSLLSNMLHISLGQGKDLVRRSCGRLLELLEDESVSVIHHSFTEFLHDATRKKDAAAFPALDDIASHEMLAVLMLEYLDGCPHFDATIDDDREEEEEEVNYDDYDWRGKERERREDIATKLRETHPLVSYAAENLAFHLKNASVQPLAIAREALTRYLSPGKPAFETWMLMNWRDRLSASFTVFHLAAAVHPELAMPLAVVKLFEENEPTLLDARDSDGRTPLSYAAENGHDEIAQFLLAKGAEAESGGNDGQTPLHRAALSGNSGVVRLLLAAGVDPMIKTHPVLREYDNYEGYFIDYSEEQAESRRKTALSFAFRGDNPEVVQAFLPFIPPDSVNKYFHQVNEVENVEAILNTGKVDIDCFQNGQTRLYRATKSHKLDLVKLLLKHGADPNRRCSRKRSWDYNGEITLQVDNERGPTPLHAFSSPDDRIIFMKDDVKEAEECARVLIEAGADVNATMERDYSRGGKNLTPLHLAVQKTTTTFGYWGSLDKSEEILAKVLLAAGADPNARTDKGNTPMHIANPEKPQLLDMLVEHGADLNAMNASGRTPLLEIITNMGPSSSAFDLLKPDVHTFNKLVDLGADVNATDQNGDNLFHHVMSSIGFFSDKEFLPLVRRLLHSGVDLNQRNRKGHPPLWKYNLPSPTDSDEELLRVLVEAGMDMNACDEEKGETILWVIGRRFQKNLSTMQMFIRLGADPKVSAKDGRTLLHDAAKEKQDASWFRYLISVGAKPEVLDSRGDTLIHSMLRSTPEDYKLPEIMQVLVEAGVSPLAKNKNGQTALHVVQSLKALEYVLKSPLFKGLNLNEQDVNGFTPLHNAIAFGDTAIGSLIRAGADPTILAADNLSLLHLASRTGASSIVNLLLSEYRCRGVLEKYVNLLGEGMAPLHYACSFGRPESVWELLRNGADPWLLDVEGLTPLHALAEFEPFEGAWNSPRTGTRTADIVVMLQQAGVDLTIEAVVEEDDGTTKTVTPLDVAVENKCWDMVRALVTRGVKVRDSYTQSPEFISATDKYKAAQNVRSISVTLPSRQHFTMWRGRWAVYEKDRPINREKLYIADGQTILDTQASGPTGLDKLDLLRCALDDGDYDSIKEYALLGGDVFVLDEYKDNTLLHLLVKGGYTDLLEYFADQVPLYEAQDGVQADDESCGTLLGTVCERELPSLNIIQFLVDKIGVDVNAVYNRRGYCYKLKRATALHILASGHHFWQIEALEYLLSKGANIEARNKDGMTPLLAALDHSWPDGYWREETVRVLVKHGANVNATIQPTEDEYGRRSRNSGLSALEISDQAGITRLLLENGADAKCVTGLIARIVARRNDPDTIKVLLEAGLDPNELPASGKDGEDDRQGAENVRYALHEVSRPSTRSHPEADFYSRNRATIELLLLHGADPFALYPDGRSLLHTVVEEQGQLDSFLPRLSQTDVNREPTYREEKPPLASIVPDSILGLLKHGADALVVDDEGRTPLHWLCTLPGKYDKKQRQAFITLVEHGPAAVNMVDKQGRKPLHLALAVYGDRLQESLFAIKHLISAGSDISEPDLVTGNSTLHQLAPRLVGHARRAAKATSLFRKFSASLDINARNVLGETPVMRFTAAGWEGTRDPKGKISHPRYAIANDVMHATALGVFVDLGADLMAVDARGQTLLHITARRELPSSSSDWDQREDLKGAFQKLMELGVDPRREDAELRTAIDIAVARKLRDVIQLFREKKEEKNVEESDG
ncbi:ankyrin repeats (3 copies) domain-containing protein [Trichoderma breve]|uniref:Ankyrin repeats (3 copies) domain-containing protein n=1 Tax=Trichoderma breve TaxID=2034170 RepID=A0A9W9E7A1_9HYPO|nr:ankyrin repeats (3 copies) domain-containing protein [Trichoderma breve]KAJ4860719.1 ankyrin repeats (3 copies) domain-containing protein [Trichoderma breve]